MAYETADSAGLGFFWAVFGCMAASSVGIGLLCMRKNSTSLLSDRMHHYVTWAIVTIAMLAYYAMATSGGRTGVRVYNTSRTTRTVYYARYIDWALTTPLILLDLVLLGNVTFHLTARIIFCDIAMILCGLFGALMSNRYKWGWFGIGCVFMLIIFYDLFVTLRRRAFLRSKGHGALYGGLATLLVLLWIIYPIIWALAEGSNAISVRAEIYCYGVLDLLAKVLFGWILVLGSTRLLRNHLGPNATDAKAGGPEVAGTSAVTHNNAGGFNTGGGALGPNTATGVNSGNPVMARNTAPGYNTANV